MNFMIVVVHFHCNTFLRVQIIAKFIEALDNSFFIEVSRDLGSLFRNSVVIVSTVTIVLVQGLAIYCHTVTKKTGDVNYNYVIQIIPYKVL